MTRTLARQMSGPVPSPSMNGMIGVSGISSLPFSTLIFAPCGGGATLAVAAVDMMLLLGKMAARDAGAGPVMLAQQRRCSAAAYLSPMSCERLRAVTRGVLTTTYGGRQ